MKEHCADCHEGDKAENGVDLISVKGDLGIRANIGKYNNIRPGNVDEGNFLGWMQLPETHRDFMPRKGTKVPDEQLAIIKKWILNGAIVDAENMTEEERVRVPDAKAFHKWKNTEGKEIEAKFGEVKEESVTLIMKNGRSYNVPLSKLDKASVELANKIKALSE